jgi:predicted acylesterase/phospholipase RssA
MEMPMTMPDATPAATDPRDPLRLTLTLSGAISLGAYEAGVVSQITYAVDGWNAKRQANGLGPVAVIDVISGASAGSITGAMLFRHIVCHGDPDQFVRDNFHCWCGPETTFRDLLTTKPTVHSLLSTEVIDDLGQKFIPDTLTADVDAWMTQDECVFTCTLTALDPIPFTFSAVTDAKQPDGSFVEDRIPGITYHDWITFGARRDAPGSVRELPDTQKVGQGRAVAWPRIRACAVASSAIPIAWEPYCISRYAADYSPPLVGTPGQIQVRYVDGGILNNMPMNRASEVLSSLIRPGEDTNRLYILIIPDSTPTKTSFPEGNVANAHRDLDTRVINVLGRTYEAVREQSFYRDLYKSQTLNRRLQVRDTFFPEVMRAAALGVPAEDLASEIQAQERALDALIGAARSAGGAHTANTQPGATDTGAILDGYLATTRDGGSLRKRHDSIPDEDRRRLFLLYVAVADRVAALNDKCLIRIGLITPAQDAKLAGYLLGHFGALTASRLMKHDFICGLQDAYAWMSGLAERHEAEWNLGADATRAVLQAAVAEKTDLDLQAVDATVSPWTDITDEEKEVVVREFVNRAAHFVLEEAGIGGPGANVGSRLEEGVLARLIDALCGGLKFPPTP